MATRSLSAWRPLLDGELQARALAVADEIAVAMLSRSEELIHEGSLAGGHAGIATTFAYLDKALPGRRYDDAASSHMNAAMDCLSGALLPPDLYGGFTGIAWAAAQVDRLAGRKSDGDDFAEIDELLLEMLSAELWPHHYDLISGLVGFGVYALERLPHPRAHECLTRIVGHLDRLSEPCPDGVTWRTPLSVMPKERRLERPDGEYNIGLAHGVPGVIALLAQASAVGAAAGDAARLVDQSVRWLFAQMLTNSPGASFGYEARRAEGQASSRSAWCYGDPGIAASLLCAAKCRGNVQWERDAVDLAVAATNRPEAELGACDAGICHGWAGLVHIFNRMYQSCGDVRLAEASRRFCERLLDAQRADCGVAGFPAWQGGPRERCWKDDAGFLEGAAGVALALAAAATEVTPSWDSVLLISNTEVP